jgi:hypothetical protein
VDPVSGRPHHDGGVPRGTRKLSAPSGREESWGNANREKAEKLGVRSLKRRADAQGFTLRHSDYGYALIDSARKPVDQRNDMTLVEVETWLDRQPG